mgnify:CR=1 FL=1
MIKYYFSFLASLFLLISVDSNAQVCNCPSNTLIVNINGDVIFGSSISITKQAIPLCDDGKVDLLELLCVELLTEGNENNKQNSTSSVCLTDGNITFSGNGVDGYCFDPEVAGVGIHDICLCSNIIDCIAKPRGISTRGPDECEGTNCCQFQIQVVDFSFNISDPCSCNDPDNIQGDGQLIALFHDVLRLEDGGMGPQILSITTSGTHPNFLDMDGNEIPAGTDLIFNGVVDAWVLDIWRPPGSMFGMGLIIELDLDDGMGGNQIYLAHYASDECLAADDCAIPIPTLSFWTLIILGILMTIFSVAFIRKNWVMDV